MTELGSVDAWDVKPGMKIVMAYDSALVNEVVLRRYGRVTIFYGTDRLETHRGQHFQIELEPPKPLPPDYGETAG